MIGSRLFSRGLASKAPGFTNPPGALYHSKPETLKPLTLNGDTNPKS